MMMARLPVYSAATAEADFATSEAIFSDYGGDAMPGELHAFFFWPWEVELLRLYSAGALDRAEAVASWRRLMGTGARLRRLADRAGVAVEGAAF